MTGSLSSKRTPLQGKGMSSYESQGIVAEGPLKSEKYQRDITQQEKMVEIENA